jgi:colicin import membrane protein
VISDTGVYWDDPALRHLVPDVGAIFGVRNRDVNRKSFNVAAEGTRPRVMVEIVSPDTRENDVEKKFVAYHRARVPVYVIVDRLTDTGPWQLHGYQHAPGKYLEMPKDGRGRLWLEDIGVWLAVEGQKIVCYDGVTDEPIGDYRQTRQQFLEARLQAGDAQVRAAEAQARAAEAQARAEAEKSRADAEAHARHADALRLQELEAEIARLRAQHPGS